MVSSKPSFRSSFTIYSTGSRFVSVSYKLNIFSLRICDHFKAKLAVFSLARGVGRNTERGKEVRFLPTMLRKIIISQGVLNITKEKQRPFQKTIYQPLNAC